MRLRVRVRCSACRSEHEVLPEEASRNWKCETCRAQLGLFAEQIQDSNPILARNTDPSSSHEAADRMIQTGRLAIQKLRVFRALQRNPGATSAELAVELGGDRYMASRRLPDLERDGLVARGPARECRARGGSAITWIALVDQEDEIR